MDSITIKDVARICGVGVSTVSRAINNHPDINEETKNMILQVIKENNYIPNNSARNLKRSVSRTIIVLIKGIDNPFFSGMIKIFAEEIQKKRYSFLLHRVDEGEDEVDVAIEMMKEKKPKGIIFLGGFFSHSRKKLEQLEIPFVLSTIAITDQIEAAGFSSVSVDDVQESYKIVSYLCQQGHKKIGILAAGQEDESIGKLRLEGYKKALLAYGITPDPSWCFYSDDGVACYTIENGYRQMKKVLESGQDFTALFAISDSIAIGACKAVFDAGKTVPEDYSIAGFDGLDMAHYYNPAITTIRQPVEEMAHATIKILFDIIRDKAQNQQKVFKGQLIEGQSTKTRK
jgi:LacI family transcriptional regulator